MRPARLNKRQIPYSDLSLTISYLFFVVSTRIFTGSSSNKTMLISTSPYTWRPPFHISRKHLTFQNRRRRRGCRTSTCHKHFILCGLRSAKRIQTFHIRHILLNGLLQPYSDIARRLDKGKDIGALVDRVHDEGAAKINPPRLQRSRIRLSLIHI